jgi:single-stranded-DNA-specific exonuclease
MMSPRWETRDPVDPAIAERLARELGISPLFAALLAARAVTDPAEADDFLNPRLATLPDPLATPGMEATAKRLAEAVTRKENVVLYGDYDVDGVTSLAICTASWSPADCARIASCPCANRRDTD